MKKLTYILIAFLLVSTKTFASSCDDIKTSIDSYTTQIQTLTDSYNNTLFSLNNSSTLNQSDQNSINTLIASYDSQIKAAKDKRISDLASSDNYWDSSLIGQTYPDVILFLKGAKSTHESMINQNADTLISNLTIQKQTDVDAQTLKFKQQEITNLQYNYNVDKTNLSNKLKDFQESYNQCLTTQPKSITTPIVSIPFPIVIPKVQIINTLTYGLKNNITDVKTLQTFLKQQGFYTGTISGIYSITTKQAIQKFQTKNKITPVNGNIGPKTKALINSLIK